MIHHLPWDSEFFKKNLYSINIDDHFSSPQLKEIFEDAKKQGAEGVYIFVNDYNTACWQTIESLGIPLMDEKVLFQKTLSPEIQPIASSITINRYSGPLTKELIDLSLEAGKYSRFKTDKILSEKFTELYTLWIDKSIRHEIADEVLVYEEDGIVKGMLTIKIKDGTGIMGIMGVDPSLQGRGVGTALVTTGENYYREKKTFISQVATQGHNEVACRLYYKFGFAVKSTQRVYHLWF